MTGRFALILFLSGILLAQASNVGELAYNDFYRMRHRSALKTYREGLKTAVRLADRKKEVIYLNNIATLFSTVGSADSCRYYLEEARKTAGGSQMLLLMTDINTAFFNQQPLSVSEEQIKGYGDSLTASELSALYTAAGRLSIVTNPDKALNFFQLARNSMEKDKRSIGYANATYYSAVAQFQKGGMMDALKLSEEAAGLFRKGEYVFGIKKCLKLQLQIFQKTGNKSDEEEAKKQLSRMP